MSGRHSPSSDVKQSVREDSSSVDVARSNKFGQDEKVAESGAAYGVKETGRLLRKIDGHLMPLLSFLYLLSFLDRSNIGNARLAGLEKSLGMKGLMYNNALAIFFPFYVAVEIPSNMMMKITRPSIWIPFIMVVWGIMTTSMGGVKNYGGLLATRSLLGIAEGGLFPGVTFYITMWYRRHECGFRMAMFFSAATAAGAFGGLLARGIMEMKNVGGLKPWQWIFILEGIFTVIVGAIAFFLMHDYPDTARFLTQQEKTEVARRLEEDRGSLNDQFQWKFVWDALKDWKIWVFCFITVGIFTPLYSFSLFLPTIISGLGYTDTRAQLMTVPPYAVACVICILCGFLADRTRQRGVFIIGCNILAIIGAIMLLVVNSDKAKYGGTFFLACGIYPNVSQITAWNGNNIGGSTKRGVGMAMQVGIGNLGGCISAYMFLPKHKPHYRPGHSGLIGLSATAAVMSICMSGYLRWENARRDRLHKRPEEYTAEERLAETDLGDNASFFRYTY